MIRSPAVSRVVALLLCAGCNGASHASGVVDAASEQVPPPRVTPLDAGRARTKDASHSPPRLDAAARDAPSSNVVVTLFGAEGSFGKLAGASTTPSGHSFQAVAVEGWGFSPGQAPYFTAVTPDGTVVIANSTQTDNQVEPTAPEMVLSTFRSDPPSFENVIVSTSRGRMRAVSPYAGVDIGGADIADLELLPASGGATRVTFISASPYDSWNIADTGLYPTLGFLVRDARGAWTYDASSSLTAADIAARSALGARACPARTNLMGESFASCGLPAEMALLPRSQAFVVTLYAPLAGAHSGRLMVMRADGTVLALLEYPDIHDGDGAVLDVLPREVDADPTAPLGDERFAVVFDVLKNGAQSAFPLQEFRFDGAAITPVSAPILTGEHNGATELRFETALYDHAGNLWAAQNEVGTLNAGSLAVYPKLDGRRALETACAAGADAGTAWGMPCPPVHSVAATKLAGSVRSFTEDPVTGAMFLGTLSSKLVVVRPHGSGQAMSFDARAPVDLGLGMLLDRTRYLVGVRKASIDAKARALYLPAMQLENDATCASYPCAPESLPGWLYRVDVDAL